MFKCCKFCVCFADLNLLKTERSTHQQIVPDLDIGGWSFICMLTMVRLQPNLFIVTEPPLSTKCPRPFKLSKGISLNSIIFQWWLVFIITKKQEQYFVDYGLACMVFVTLIYWSAKNIRSKCFNGTKFVA